MIWLKLRCNSRVGSTNARTGRNTCCVDWARESFSLRSSKLNLQPKYLWPRASVFLTQGLHAGQPSARPPGNWLTNCDCCGQKCRQPQQKNASNTDHTHSYTRTRANAHARETRPPLVTVDCTQSTPIYAKRRFSPVGG